MTKNELEKEMSRALAMPIWSGEWDLLLARLNAVASMKRDRKVHYNGTKMNDHVTTPDGDGVIVGGNMRKNTNGGPGVRQLVVRLEDGRVRHYSKSDLTVKK